jgi:hypothetical protein
MFLPTRLVPLGLVSGLTTVNVQLQDAHGQLVGSAIFAEGQLNLSRR